MLRGRELSRLAAAVVATMTVFFCSAAVAETRPYWIFFTDRGPVDVPGAVAAKIASAAEPKSVSRRARVYGPERIFDERDIPVYAGYIDAVSELTGGIRTVTRWFNGVSADLDDGMVERVGRLPFVRELRPVAVFTKPEIPQTGVSPKPARPERGEYYSPADYGDSFEQASIIGVVGLHRRGYTGAGITIAVLDSGFDGLSHAAFDSMTVGAARDFVDGDSAPGGDDHGTEVLSIIAGLDRGGLIGTAPHATFLLARTENVEGNVEQRVEEDYWVAGVEWADSLGADIVNSSLGYTEFDDGTAYRYEDLDGDTAVTTIAADAAAEKGMIVVTSAGNEGDKPWYYVTTPADADSAFAVGSVDVGGTVSGFSSRGPTFDGRVKPDFLALGERVLVVDAARAASYRFADGTSYAAPSVSGAVALILHVNPGWEFGDLREALIRTAKSAGPDSLGGYGIIDAFDASGLEQTGPTTAGFRVYDPFPQPVRFDDRTRWVYFPVEVPVGGKTMTIKLYNFNGEVVRILSSPVAGSGSFRSPGEAPAWDGTNFSGEDVAPGVYYYTIQLYGYGMHTGKIMVMR